MKKRTNKRKTTEQFIADAVAVHRDKHDYSKVEYINAKTKVCIICPEHGEFWQNPNNHLNGQGCPKCGSIKNVLNIRKYHSSIKDWNFTQPEDYKLIPLTQGKFAKVDNEDFDKLKDINWSFNNGYAYHSRRGMMHRLILGCNRDMLVDHINPEATLDNRKYNLRIVDKSKNAMNSRPRKGYSSKFKGVCWCNRSCKWRSYIVIHGKQTHIGYFSEEEDAVKAYDAKAKELFGEFARLNFPLLMENIVHYKI